MAELARFQQVRPAQTIQEESKQQLGLSLYPDNGLSELATTLVGATDTDTYNAALARAAEKDRGAALLTHRPPHPTVMAVYDWLEFKARPLRAKDFAAMVESLKIPRDFDLAVEWTRIADNFVLALANRGLGIDCRYDMQALIRACRMLATAGAVDPQTGRFALSDRVTDAWLDRLTTSPVLLPAEILRHRCYATCREASTVIKRPAEIVVGRGGKCSCTCPTDCQAPKFSCICIRPYVADLFLIRETLARYEAGELADIQNILAGEVKSRHHRFLTHSESSTETDAENDTSEERDHQVDEKNSLQSEVKKTIDDKTAIDAGVTATIKYGTTATITPHANVNASFAKSQSSNIARAYAKDVVDRSVSKIDTKTRSVQISKLITETEERNRDEIDNKEGNHRSGLFYWVNKVTHGQVFNYGRHMMFDMIVPEPAAMFKALMDLKSRRADAAQAPVKPDLTLGSITRTSYLDLLAQYGVSTTDDIVPPDDTIHVSLAFAQNLATDDGKTAAFSSADSKVAIPDTYKATSVSYDIRCACADPGSTDPKDNVAVSVNFGALCLMVEAMNEYASGGGQKAKNWKETGSHALSGETGDIAVALAGYSSLPLEISGALSIQCKLTDEGFIGWQTKIYNLIMADYNRRLAAYQATTGSNVDFVQIKGRNPFLNREIERNEFKRHIIAILLCNYFNGIGSMVDHVAPCGYPEFDFEKLSQDMPIVQFFEQVFEWEYMTYLFYHSMWARKCKWPDLIDEDSGDPLFDKFLMSGAARVQVPIRPGMDSLFLWFLHHGEIWGKSGVPPLPGDSDYVSMIQELKEADQGDYSDRPGLVDATNGSDTLNLTGSQFYWDIINDAPGTLAVDDDIDRELLIDYKVYRIVAIADAGAADHSAWTITIDPPFAGATAQNLKHGVGAVFVGAPWEIVVPTELVYLRNPQDTLPVYPLA